MSRRIIVIGLAALCAVALSAVAASGASAAGATAFTCVSSGFDSSLPHNTNEHCVPGSTGGAFGHQAIVENEPTQVTLNDVTGHTSQVLFTEAAGAEVELIGNHIECLGCMAENKTVSSTMEVTGGTGATEEGKIRYTGVKVVGQLANDCQIAGETVTTEALKFTTTSATGATIEPKTGTTLATIHFQNKAPEECPLTNVPVKGKAAATVSGATLKVNVTLASEELKVGGEPASLVGEATLEAGLTEGVHHPAALTAT
jgi:hypothetical protein